MIVVGARAKRGPLTRRQRRQLALGLLFTGPWIVGLLAFNVYPILASLFYSFTYYDLLEPPRFVGLSNYGDLLFHDTLFWTALGNTFYYAGGVIAGGTLLDIGLALLLNARVRGMGVYRTLFFLPSVVPAVAGALIWLWVLNPQYGFLNSVLGLVGLPGPSWFQDPAWSKPSLILLGLWTSGQAIIIYLAALQDVPRVLYEAAEIDGAGPWSRTRAITLPMITPAILFNVVIGIILAFQYFTQAYIVGTGLGTVLGGDIGGPLDSTLFVGLYLYNHAFAYLHMGYASAMAWIFTLIILALTLGVMRSSGRWVYYGGVR